jgi:hypothetical protein
VKREIRIVNGCHNCANMRDFTDWDDSCRYVCLLEHPELKNELFPPGKFHDYVNEHATCDRHVLGEPSKPTTIKPLR